MTLDKIKIKNFKSIQELEFDIKKHATSYTTMLLGINEVGKSNILEAISFLETPSGEYNFSQLHNQKNETGKYIDLYFYMSFESKQSYLKDLKNIIKNSKEFDCEIKNISKNVYLSKDKNDFSEAYSYTLIQTKKFFIKNISDIDDKYLYELSENEDIENGFIELNEEIFNDYFDEIIIKQIKKYEPTVSFWKSSSKYLLSSIDLNDFKDNIYSNIPLKNIFSLSGYTVQKDIANKIEEIDSPQLRSKLKSKLSQNITKYIKSIWKHNILIDIDITDSGMCNVSVKDGGKNNEHEFFKMDERSQGFKQFISLILSLSIETKKLKRKHKLILIDEPETHLHPSGIRDLGKELLAMGENNYLFVATHSPFLIDRNNKERNIIIKKDASACTIKKEITSENDIRDDEVLGEAFGINVYRDLMTPHKLLVEGASDKLILQKAFKFLDIDYGITNGAGSNIVQIASKFNHDDIGIMVIVDDDKEGKKYKADILKIGGVFNDRNIFTLRDLVGSMNSEGTIEDLLGKEFVVSIYQKFYDEFIKEGTKNIKVSLEDKPFMEQIKIDLQKDANLKGEKLKATLNQFKKKLSEDFAPKKTSFGEKFPLLKELVDKVKEKYAN